VEKQIKGKRGKSKKILEEAILNLGIFLHLRSRSVVITFSDQGIFRRVYRTIFSLLSHLLLSS
jgi:hypothetical protein